MPSVVYSCCLLIRPIVKIVSKTSRKVYKPEYLEELRPAGKVMSDKEQYRKYTMKELIRILTKLRIQEINEQSILAPTTNDI